MTSPHRIRALLLDLDDTLFPQSSWLDGAWSAVADAGAAHGVDRTTFGRALRAVAAEGSDRGRIIDRALALVGRPDVAVEPLVERFQAHDPGPLDPYPGVPEAIEEAAGWMPLGLVTDGLPSVQRSKLAALGLGRHFSSIVVSDDFGRAHRKPSPVPFRAALEELGVAPRDAVHVGDRPEKDALGAAAAGLRFVRVRTGEYAHCADVPGTWASAPDLRGAVQLLLGRRRA